MKIVRVEAIPLRFPMNFSDLGIDHPGFNSITHVEVETDTGLIGYGMTSITQARPVAEAVNSVLGPEIVDLNALFHEEVWNRMYWKATPWGQTGYASHAISAIDLALWDIKGKACERPVWQVLGGARSALPNYATCGFSFLDDDELVDVIKRVVALGFRGVKLQVGRPGLGGGETSSALNDLIKSDVKRVKAIRSAVDPIYRSPLTPRAVLICQVPGNYVRHWKSWISRSLRNLSFKTMSDLWLNSAGKPQSRSPPVKMKDWPIDSGICCWREQSMSSGQMPL